MSHREQHDTAAEQAVTAGDGIPADQEFTDTGTFGQLAPTIDSYSRRGRILADARKTEWWLAIAAMLIIAGMGFVALY